MLLRKHSGQALQGQRKKRKGGKKTDHPTTRYASSRAQPSSNAGRLTSREDLVVDGQGVG